MNPEYEVIDEPETMPAVVIEPVPEGTTDPEAFKTFLTQYKTQATALVPTDPASVRICQAFVMTCKVARKFAESVRTALVGPLNKQVDDYNATWQPIVKGFEAMALEVDRRVTTYNWQKDQEAIAEQRRLQAEADRKKLELEQEQERLRKAAEAERTNGNELTALKLETKADKVALKAETVVTTVVQTEARKALEVDGMTLTAGKMKKTWNLPGWDGKSKLYVNDPLLKGCPLDFLLPCLMVDPVKLNAMYAASPTFPKPFCEVPKPTSSRLT